MARTRREPSYISTLNVKLDALEAKFEELHADIKDIKEEQAKMREEIAGIKATGKMLKWIAGVTAAIVSGIIAAIGNLLRK